jgi:hypothetical protein
MNGILRQAQDDVVGQDSNPVHDAALESCATGSG